MAGYDRYNDEDEEEDEDSVVDDPEHPFVDDYAAANDEN